MPTISMFYGILICMYFYDDERHSLPHIHAKYQGQEASFSILDGSCLNGDIPQQSFAWFKPGLKSIANLYSLTGSLRLVVNR